MSTLLDELPTGNNINISVTEPPQSMNKEQTLQLDQNTINQIVNGLQTATGLTKLPSRDIPKITNDLTQDPNIIQDYIEPEEKIRKSILKSDYIDEEEYNVSKEDIKKRYEKKKDLYNQVDVMYDEMNGPLLIAILYFIFQLPFFKKCMLKYIPLLFHDDYNYNFYGYVFVSVFFSMIYYIVTYGLKQFDKF
jgi:hypothetical protein